MASSKILNPILNIEGSWEYWIQIDFPAWLDQYLAQQYDFRREVYGIIPGRIDWLINSIAVGGTLTAVELKWQTHKYISSTFVGDIVDDITKLRALPPTYNRIVLAAVIDYFNDFSILMHVER